MSYKDYKLDKYIEELTRMITSGGYLPLIPALRKNEYVRKFYRDLFLKIIKLAEKTISK